MSRSRTLKSDDADEVPLIVTFQKQKYENDQDASKFSCDNGIIPEGSIKIILEYVKHFQIEEKTYASATTMKSSQFHASRKYVKSLKMKPRDSIFVTPSKV